jgi:hypothetical protein
MGVPKLLEPEMLCLDIAEEAGGGCRSDLRPPGVEGPPGEAAGNDAFRLCACHLSRALSSGSRNTNGPSDLRRLSACSSINAWVVGNELARWLGGYSGDEAEEGDDRSKSGAHQPEAKGSGPADFTDANEEYLDVRAVEGEEEGELGVRDGNEGEGNRETEEEGVGNCWFSSDQR